MTELDFHSLAAADDFFVVAMPDGALLPVYELAGPKGAPALLFGHANGLAAGSYEPWLRMLARRVRVFAFDARGHGGSRWPEGALEEVFGDDRMAEDLLPLTRAVAARAAGAPLAYAGHSLGAEAALRLLVLGHAPAWSTFIAIEPPIFPTPDCRCYAMAIGIHVHLLRGTARRRRDWSSPAALFERIKTVPMFRHADRAMLMAHCHAILRPLPEGGFRLCCPPEVENMIYRVHGQADTWSRLGRITRPVEIIGGDPATPQNDWISSAMPELVALLPHGRLATVAGTGHMPMFEKPEQCAALVFERLGLI